MNQGFIRNGWPPRPLPPATHLWYWGSLLTDDFERLVETSAAKALWVRKSSCAVKCVISRVPPKIIAVRGYGGRLCKLYSTARHSLSDKKRESPCPQLLHCCWLLPACLPANMGTPACRLRSSDSNGRRMIGKCSRLL